MSVCTCLIQSGPRAGEPCGRKIKGPGKVCGVHKKKCIPASTPPHAKLADQEKNVLRYVNKIILERDLDTLTSRKIKELVEKKFGPTDMKPYREYIKKFSEQKLRAINTQSCKACNALMANFPIPYVSKFVSD